jgi:hypothetical protein
VAPSVYSTIYDVQRRDLLWNSLPPASQKERLFHLSGEPQWLSSEVLLSPSDGGLHGLILTLHGVIPCQGQCLPDAQRISCRHYPNLCSLIPQEKTFPILAGCPDHSTIWAFPCWSLGYHWRPRRNWIQQSFRSCYFSNRPVLLSSPHGHPRVRFQ